MSKLNLPRREFPNGEIHYGAPFMVTGVLCGGRVDQAKDQTRVRSSANCARCIEIVEWVWAHRTGKHQGGRDGPPRGEPPQRSPPSG